MGDTRYSPSFVSFNNFLRDWTADWTSGVVQGREQPTRDHGLRDPDVVTVLQTIYLY